MNSLKFSGVLTEIIERYPNIDIVEYLEQTLDIPSYKAEELAARIEKKYCHKTNRQTEQNSMKTILEKPNKPEIPPKPSIYSVDCLSEEEFEQFMKWLFEELGYEVHSVKRVTELCVALVAFKDGEKTAVQAIKCPKRYRVSNSAILLSREVKRAFQCEKSIIVATGSFTEQAVADAKKSSVELWDSAVLDVKIDEVKKNADLTGQSCFPPFKESLMESLFGLEETKDFIVEPRADGKYDLHLLGVKYPMLTFQVQSGEVIRCVYRIKNNEPVGESEGAVLIKSERNNRFGPDDVRAYALIVEYLKQFFE